MSLGLFMPLTPLAGGTGLLEGYITVGSLDLGGGVFYAYGYSSGDDPELPMEFGSVSGAASPNMIVFYWVPGLVGGVRFNTEAFVGKYLYFMDSYAQIVSGDGMTGAQFFPEESEGWPTSGTHPFYVGPPPEEPPYEEPSPIDMLLELFDDGQRGVLLDFANRNTLYQDWEGTVPVTTTNNPIGLVKDLSGNDFDMYQSDSLRQGRYRYDGVGRVQLDKSYNNYWIDFGGTGGFEATWYQGSKEGLVVGKLLIPDGVWKIAREDPNYFPSNNVMGLIIVEGDVSPAMDATVRQWFADRGCGMDFGAMTTFQNAFRERRDVIALDCGHWDTSNVTSFAYFGSYSGIQLLDMSSWDLSAVTTGGWSQFMYMNVNLTTVLVAPGKAFSTITYGNLTTSIFQNTYLSQESIDNILVNLETCAVDNGTFRQSGGSAPSAIGKAAIDALRLRGWTITVTGGY